MPPIRRSARGASKPKGFWAGSSSNRKVAKKRAKSKRPVRNYNKQATNFQRKAPNMLQIKTLTPRELTVGIQYKTVISISNMGYGASGNLSGTNTILRVAMNNPCKGVNGSIVDIISLGGTHTDPSFTRTNSTLNLDDKLAQYFDQYGRGVVTSSNVKVRVISKPNQYKLGQWQSNVDAQGAQGDQYPYDENHMPYLKSNNPELDGQSYVWSIKTKNTGLFQNGPGGDTPTYHENQNSIPGLKMSQLIARSNGTSSAPVLCSGGFTPKYFGLHDWRDNIQKVMFRKSGTNEPDVTNRAYFYVGVQNRFPAVSTMKPQNVDFEVVCNFNCRFLQRIGDVEGGDAPIPEPIHSTEL